MLERGRMLMYDGLMTAGVSFFAYAGYDLYAHMLFGISVEIIILKD